MELKGRRDSVRLDIENLFLLLVCIRNVLVSGAKNNIDREILRFQKSTSGIIQTSMNLFSKLS